MDIDALIPTDSPETEIADRPSVDNTPDSITENLEVLTRGEMMLIARAFRLGWPTTAEKQRRNLLRLQATIRNPNSSRRVTQRALETQALLNSDGVIASLG